MLSIPYVKNIELDNDFRSLLSSKNELWSHLDSYQKEFYDNKKYSTTVFIIKDKNLFSLNKLTKLKEFAKEIETITFIKQVDSIFNQTNYKLINDDLTIENFFGELNKESITKNLTDIQTSTFAHNVFINSKQDTTLIKLSSLSEQTNEKDRQTRHQLDRLIEKYRPHFQNIQTTGAIYEKTEIGKVVKETALYPTLISLLFIVIILSIASRSIFLGLIVFFGSLISIVLSLLIFKLIGIKLTIFTSTVPLLIIVIGACEDCYLATNFFNFKRKNVKQSELFKKTINKCAKPILLAFITTFISFLAFTASNNPGNKDFGIAISIGLLLNFIVTLSLTPAILALLSSHKSNRTKAAPDSKIKLFIYNKLILFTENYSKVIYFFTGLILLSFLSTFHLIKTDLNPRYFLTDTHFLRKSEKEIKKIFGKNIFTAHLILESDQEDFFTTHENIKKINQIQQYIEKTKYIFGTSNSIYDILESTHQLLNKEKKNLSILKNDDALISQYLLFIDEDNIRPFLSRDTKKTSITVYYAPSYDDRTPKAFNQLVSYTKSVFTDKSLTIYITGRNYATAQSLLGLMEENIDSLWVVIFVLTLLISVIFTNLKIGILSIIPNLIPLIVVTLFMIFFNIPLTILSSLIFIIVIGISVNDTIHFMTRYNTEIKRHDNIKLALRQTIKGEMIAVIFSSFALIGGFLSLTYSDNKMVGDFSLLLSVGILSALICDLLLTPIILKNIKLITVLDIINLKYKQLILQKSPLFKGMSSYEIKKFILLSQIKTYKKGQIIIKQEDIAESLFFILNGSVDILVTDKNNEQKKINTLNAGQSVGEISYVTKKARSAFVIAREDTDLLEISYASLDTLSKSSNIIANKMYKNFAKIISKRLLQSNIK